MRFIKKLWDKRYMYLDLARELKNVKHESNSDIVVPLETVPKGLKR